MRRRSGVGRGGGVWEGRGGMHRRRGGALALVEILSVCLQDTTTPSWSRQTKHSVSVSGV